MPNYQNGKIYKIVNTVDDKIYVGSTTLSLTKRFKLHKNPNQKWFCCCYEHFINVGFNNVDIELIEDYPCDTKKELLEREKYFINELKSELNIQSPILSDKEKKEYQVKYRTDNKDKLNKQKMDWAKKNKDKVNKSNREYVENNKDKVKASKQKWNEANKDKLAEIKKKYEVEVASKPYTCVCGATFGRRSLTRHMKSKKHLNNI